MCKKLYKHEILSYLRKWLPMEIVIISISLLGRFVQFFENDTKNYDIIFGSTIFFYGMSLCVSFVLTFVLCITRFHKNLFSGEGYLTFTLPVAPSHHIIIKALAAVTVQIATFLVAFLSVGIITAGEVGVEILKAAGYLFKKVFEVSSFHLILYILEAIILFFTSAITAMLLIYACITLGQTMKKNRVVGAIAIYFIYQFICRILSTILMSVLSTTPINYDGLLMFAEKHPLSVFHILFGAGLLFCLITASLYYFITYTVIKKKLNLE